MDNNSARTEFKQLIARGKEQGYLTIDEINDLIPPDIISGDQLSVFIQTFIDMGITVCDTPPEADDLLLNGNSQTDAEDVEIVANQLDSSVDIGRTTDPVRMYMREMGNVSLLTRKDEIEISKRIERGTNEVQLCLVEFPQAMEELFSRYQESLIENSDVKLGDIVSGFSEPHNGAEADVEVSDEELNEVDTVDVENVDDVDNLEGSDDLDDLDDVEESPVAATPAKASKKSKKVVAQDEDEEDEAPNDAESGPDPEEAQRRFTELRVQFDKVTVAREKKGAVAERKYARELAKLVEIFSAFKIVPSQLERLLRLMHDMMDRVKRQDRRIREICVLRCGMIFFLFFRHHDANRL